MARRKKKFNAKFLLFLLIIIGIIIFFSMHKKVETTNINIAVESKYAKLYKKLDLENYSNIYSISNEYQTVIKDNTIYLVDLKNETLIETNNLINDLDHFKLFIDHLLHQKYKLSYADELAEKEHIYMLKEHDLIVYFNEYNSSDYLTVNYNEVKDYLLFEPSYKNDYENEDYYKLDPNKITIALTFDDGPNSKRTLELIELLEKYEYSATFFNLGNKYRNGKTAVLRVYNSHSEVGYHSYKHAYLTKQTKEEIQEEFTKSDEIFYDLTGSHLKMIRPPYGSYNDDVLQSLDLPFILWNLDTNDWKYRDAENAKNYVMKNYKDGAIILFHDTYNSSVEAIKMILPLLKEKDVQVTSISRLAKLKGITLEPNTVYKSFN